VTFCLPFGLCDLGLSDLSTTRLAPLLEPTFSLKCRSVPGPCRAGVPRQGSGPSGPCRAKVPQQGTSPGSRHCWPTFLDPLLQSLGWGPKTLKTLMDLNLDPRLESLGGGVQNLQKMDGPQFGPPLESLGRGSKNFKTLMVQNLDPPWNPWVGGPKPSNNCWRRIWTPPGILV
jgi:hypothetical protein